MIRISVSLVAIFIAAILQVLVLVFCVVYVVDFLWLILFVAFDNADFSADSYVMKSSM